jgi:hypothetical protein
MNKKDNKKIITVQLPTDLYEQLAMEAEGKLLTLSAYVRLLLIKNHEYEKEEHKNK